MLFLAFALPGLAQHYFVDESNGLKYLLDDEKHTAELINQPGTLGNMPSSLYSAEKYVIPSHVQDGGVSYTVTKLGDYCFNRARTLQEVILPATIEEVADGSFKNCGALRVVHLNEGLKKIGEECFEGTPSLEQITIPASVTEVGKRLFNVRENSERLTITLLSSTPVEIKGDMSIYSEFYAHHSLVVPSGSEEVYKKHPIWGKFFMTDYTDPVTGFKYRLNATTKTATLVRSVDADGKSLYTEAKYTLPSTVHDGNGVEYALVELGDHCFSGYLKNGWEEMPNETLQEITLPSTVKKVGWACFLNCSNLKDVKLSEQLEELSDSCFALCTSLDYVAFPQGMTKIGEQCFLYCKSLQSVQLPNNILKLENGCFAACYSLINVVLPENCESLYGCFTGCSKLAEIVIPSKVNYVYNTFDGCTSLHKIVCNAVVPPVSYGLGDWKLYRDCKLQVPEGSEDNYKESEGWEKFYHVYLTAQDNGLSYDLNPRTQTGTLKRLEWDENGEVISEESYVVPAQIMEGDVTYTITDMDVQCFYRADKLRSVSIPATIEKLPEGCFSNCRFLSSVQLSEGLKVLGQSCFSNCDNLKDLELPQTLETIGNYCFAASFAGGNLKTITIPASVKEIGNFAFGGFNNVLNSIYCESEEPIPAKDILVNNGMSGEVSSLYGTITLYVPVGSIDKYKASEEWGRFTNIKEFVPSTIKGIVVNEHNDKSANIYTLDGKNVGANLQALPKGIYVQYGKKIVVK